MREYLEEQKKHIISYMNEYMRKKSGSPLEVDGMDRNVLSTLISFSERGKMLRGGLVQLGFSLFSKEKTENTVAAGACLELLQSALLIHDDIMDRDQVRRNKPSLYYRYKDRAVEMKITGAYHLGESMGICAGDIAFFTGIDMLSDLDCTAEMYKKAVELCTQEMILVGTAQMKDVLFGTMKKMISLDDILELYRLKTGRYTFSLPFILGATLAGAAENETVKLGSIGEKMGIVFQIKDDELGLFSSEKVLGKPIGGDIREGKKTIFIHLLYQKAKTKERDRIRSILGNPDASEKDIEYIRKMITEYEIRNDVDSIAAEITSEFAAETAGLSCCRREAVEVLEKIQDYNIKRRY